MSNATDMFDAGVAALLGVVPDLPTATPPWRQVTEDQIRRIIAGTCLESLVHACEMVTDPPLPLAVTLQRACVVAGAALSFPVRNYDPDEEAPPPRPGDADWGQSQSLPRGIDLARLRIDTAGGQACNAWGLLVAPSGSGKDVGNIPDRLAGSMNVHIGTSGSAEGLADAFKETGNGFLEITEFVPFLKSTTWQSNAAIFLTSAWNKGWFRYRMSKRTGHPVRESRFCYPSILANIQPDLLAEFVTNEALAGGFLYRFLFAQMSLANRRPRRSYPDNVRLEAERALRTYGRQQGVVQPPEGHLQGVLDEFIEFDAPHRSHWSRLVEEYGCKFAVMLSVRTNTMGSSPDVRPEHWAGAAQMVRFFYRQAELVLADVTGTARDRERLKRMRRVFLFIRKQGSAKRTAVSRRFSRDMDSLTRETILVELVNVGAVLIDETGAFKPTENPPGWVMQNEG